MSFGGGFSQPANAEAKSESKAEGVLPCFIKMILNQPEDIINLYGMEYKMITVVAIVRNIEHTSTKITYEVEDYSGRIFAHLWIDENESKQPNIMINSYVRLIGAIRSQNEKKTIMLFKIYPVSGINEVNTHYLEAINARYQAEEFARGGDMSDNFKSSKMDVDQADNFNLPNVPENLTGKEKAILNLIFTANGDSEGGRSREEIQKTFNKMTAKEIQNALDVLINEGLIFTTIDQDHYSACF